VLKVLKVLRVRSVLAPGDGSVRAFTRAWELHASKISLPGSWPINSRQTSLHLLHGHRRREISNTAIKSANRSDPPKRNTSEGFGRYHPKEFARFLRIAAGSLQETKNHL
jgi:23S rRNA-intervening sequence protein